MEKFTFISTPSNMINNSARYIEIAEAWGLVDEVTIASNMDNLKASTAAAIKKSLYLCAFDSDGKYNERRATTLIKG